MYSINAKFRKFRNNEMMTSETNANQWCKQIAQLPYSFKLKRCVGIITMWVNIVIQNLNSSSRNKLIFVGKMNYLRKKWLQGIHEKDQNKNNNFCSQYN